jgi:hypothetical protein
LTNACGECAAVANKLHVNGAENRFGQVQRLEFVFSKKYFLQKIFCFSPRQKIFYSLLSFFQPIFFSFFVHHTTTTHTTLAQPPPSYTTPSPETNFVMSDAPSAKRLRVEVATTASADEQLLQTAPSTGSCKHNHMYNSVHPSQNSLQHRLNHSSCV